MGAPLQKKRFDSGAELSHKDSTTVPADQPLRPLRDTIIVEPLDAVMSSVIHVIHETKPLRGIVKAVGPGCYPRRYDHPEKHRRTKMWSSKVFRPTQVKIGDVVELGGAEHGGYAFQTFYWGDKLHLFAREEDVCAIVTKVEAEDHAAAA